MSRNESKETTLLTAPITPTMAAAAKLCHIVKRADFEGYGFNLHSEKVKQGQYVGKVDANSPAEAAGLKEGDRIIEVNGAAIGNETHKLVVQRIKAIACEVRLLLIDADGGKTTKATKTFSNDNNEAATAVTNGNGSLINYQGTKHEMLGASANISSISMVSTKRMSNASNHSNNSSSSNDNNSKNHQIIDSMDETDKVITAVDAVTSLKQHNNTSGSQNVNREEQQRQPHQHQGDQQHIASKNNMNAKVDSNANEKDNMMTYMTMPSPPTASDSTLLRQEPHTTSTEMITISAIPSTTMTTTMSTYCTSDTNSINRAGSLQLPMTAAEMRAKLMSKKKYDPKNESVDLKKKFEIIQKL